MCVMAVGCDHVDLDTGFGAFAGSDASTVRLYEAGLFQGF